MVHPATTAKLSACLLRSVGRAKAAQIGAPIGFTPSLLVFAWLAWKELHAESFGQPIWFGLSLLAVLGLAGIKMRILLRELAYHRDMIALARKLQTTLGLG